MSDLIFDASSLIAAVRFEVDGQTVLDHILAKCQILIPEAVKIEAIDEGLRGGYPDAVILDRRVKSGSLNVIRPVTTQANLESVLDDYGLEEGDKALLLLCRNQEKYLWAVVDDRLLYIVLNRFDLRPRFLPDVIAWLVPEKFWTLSLGEATLKAIQPRYRAGFISHSLERINGRL
jgi:hypothetical protein